MHFSRLSFAFLFLFVFFSRSLFALPQFINEFHYDNAGGDVNEFVEIAGLAGSDLNGWSLAFYNGTSGGVYASWNLSGVISDEMNGYGVLAFTASHSLQNGSNDGIALVDDLGQLIQFLSYEGALTATSGAAQGQTSVDIGVSEDGNTPVGYSLQLTGLGLQGNGFSWAAAPSSYATLNSGQLFLPSTPPLRLPAVTVGEPNSLTLLLLGLALLLLRRMFKFDYIDFSRRLSLSKRAASFG